MSRELLQQALDALETKYSDYIYDGAGSAIAGAFEDDVAALRAALAQPAPAVQVVLRQPNLFAADPAAPAVNCEWTNCPRRVGDVCCNDRPAAPAVPDGLRGAVNALLHQIEIGDFVDSNGHSAKMLKPVHDLMRLISESAAPAMREPQDERIRWRDAVIKDAESALRTAEQEFADMPTWANVGHAAKKVTHALAVIAALGIGGGGK